MHSFNHRRLPLHLQKRLTPSASVQLEEPLPVNQIYQGDARRLLPLIAPDSIALSVWSPPYFVGKAYESDLTFEDWQSLLSSVIALHYPIIEPGGFLVVNIADILCFRDE